MNAQLKYSFKKESAQFFRSFKLLGILLAIFGFALMYPLMSKMMGVILGEMNNMEMPQVGTAAIQSETASLAEANADGLGLGNIAEVYGSASSVFSLSLISLATYSSLIIMLVMMKPAGGEQKKRAMIVPLCCGLQYKNYLIPKFVIYPLSVFAVSFLGGLTAGGLCSSMFKNDAIHAGTIALASLMIGVYMAFVITVYLALGLCSSRPGVMVGVVFLGQMLLPSLLGAIGLSDYQPFSLLNLISALSAPNAGDIISENLTNILVSSVIAIAIGVLLFFITLAVLNGKRVDNRQEDKPEF